MKKLFIKRQQTKGFTLIEIMVALTIVSVGLFAILSSISQSARNQSHLKDKMLATWVADNQFAYLKSLDEPLQNDQGQETMAGRVWLYQQEVETTSNKNLQKVTLKVFLQGSENKSVGTYIAYIPSITRQIIE